MLKKKTVQQKLLTLLKVLVFDIERTVSVSAYHVKYIRIILTLFNIYL